MQYLWVGSVPVLISVIELLLFHPFQHNIAQATSKCAEEGRGSGRLRGVSWNSLPVDTGIRSGVYGNSKIIRRRVLNLSYFSKPHKTKIQRPIYVVDVSIRLGYHLSTKLQTFRRSIRQTSSQL